jgi:hypothetical protein
MNYIKRQFWEEVRQLATFFVTQWFEPTEPPVHIGWYETVAILDESRPAPADTDDGYMAFWDGNEWKIFDRQEWFDGDRWHKARIVTARHQTRYWRGHHK